MLPRETHFRAKDTHRKRKDGKKTFHANRNEKNKNKNPG